MAQPPEPGGRGRLFFYSGGFLRERGLRRILTLAGYDLRLGLPGPGDSVAVWGRSPTAARGEGIAARRGAGLIRVEDAFLRGLHPGDRGEPPAGLLIDPLGVHFDSAAPSRLERILASDPLDETSLLQRARDGMARMATLGLSKYNNADPALPLPEPGYVLVIDQHRGDASIRHGGASADSFRAMLSRAREDHPRARIVIKAHPAGQGHFGPADCDGRTTLIAAPVLPRALLEGAIAVLAVTSQMGFEAILAGHRPRIFGQPFYAGWGLSDDESPVPRRGRSLTRTQLFAAAMVLAPVWYDPFRDRLCPFETALDLIEARVRAFREDRAGHVAGGMRRWKRPVLRRFFGQTVPLRFAAEPAAARACAARDGRGLLLWGDAAPDLPSSPPMRRVEDGFLRSRGLGARLVPPLSLIADDLGIHYDPARESRLERLIAAPPPPGGEARAERLIARLAALGLTKYNLPSTPLPDLPPGRRILVPGQVEDDASVRLGCPGVTTNLGLLAATRAANPDAVILYKPHPDVVAGLRKGAVAATEALRHADLVLPDADPAALIGVADEVWTLTSLLGFEALIRGKRVTCLGLPFYAGWGLTRDLAAPPARRSARPTLAALVHAALIAYPRYVDPGTGRPCPVEVIVDRLAARPQPEQPLVNRGLAGLQRLIPAALRRG